MVPMYDSVTFDFLTKAIQHIEKTPQKYAHLDIHNDCNWVRLFGNTDNHIVGFIFMKILSLVSTDSYLTQCSAPCQYFG